jgi:hypothetical protein
VAWARGVPAARDLPEIDGAMELKASLVHRDDFKRIEADAEMRVSASARIEADGETRVVPEQRIELTASTALDAEARRVDHIEAALNSPMAEGLLRGRSLQWDDFGASESLDASFTADLGAASELAAQFLHGEDIRALDARASVRAELLPAEAGSQQLAFTLDFAPDRLITLKPFAENPDWLAEGPLELGALGFTWEGRLVAAPKNETFTVSAKASRGEVLELREAEVRYAETDAAWEAAVEAGVDLTRLFGAIVRRVAGGALDELGGAIMLTAEAGGREDEAIRTRGRMDVSELRVALPGSEGAAGVGFDEALTRLTWDAGFDADKGELALDAMDLENSFLKMAASGEVSAKSISGLTARGRFDLGALADRLVEALGLESPPGGVLTFEARAQGDTERLLEATLRVETPEPIEYAQPGLAVVSLPLGMDARAAVHFGGGKAERVEAWIDRLVAGDVLSAGGSASVGLGDETRVDARGFADAAFAPALEMIDPAFWEQHDMAAVMEGASRLELAVTGVVPTNGDGARAGDALDIQGTLATRIESMEFASGALMAAGEGFSDRREFAVNVSGLSPESVVYRDRAESGLEYLETSEGAVIAGFSMRTAVEAPGKGRATFAIEELTLEETLYADERVEAQLPPLHVSGRFSFDPETGAAEAREVAVDLEGLAAMTMDAAYGGESRAWSARVRADVGPLGSFLDHAVFREEGAMPITGLSGAMTLDADFRGTLPGEEFDPKDGIPAEGRLSARWADVGVRQGEALSVEGIEGRAHVEVLPGGNDFRGELSLSVGRVEMEALEGGPLESTRVAASFGMEGMDRVNVELSSLEAPSLGLKASGSGRAAGLRRVLDADTPMAPGDYLHVLDFSGEFEMEESLAELGGLVEGLEAGGTARVSASLNNEADRALRFVSSMSFDDVRIRMREQVALEGLSGGWTAGKTLPLRAGLATPKSPPPGRLHAEAIRATADPFDVELLGNTMTFEGFQSGFSMLLESEHLIGGPATIRAGLGVRGDDPVLSGRVQVTGMDLGRLAVPLRDLQGPEAEINGVADFQWRLPEAGAGGLLNGMTLQAASSRIGKRAFQRILEALDPEQEDPRIQKAITALTLGRPSSVGVELRDSLLTFGAELETLGGFTVPLPIFDRQSLGDVEQVYELEEYAPLVQMLRTALLLLLAEISKRLNATSTPWRPRHDCRSRSPICHERNVARAGDDGARAERLQSPALWREFLHCRRADLARAAGARHVRGARRGPADLQQRSRCGRGGQPANAAAAHGKPGGRVRRDAEPRLQPGRR